MAYFSYLRSIIIGILIGCLIFLLAVLYQIGTPINSYTSYLNELYNLKDNIANSINSPKIVVIAGSNARYGISCKMLYEKTTIPCINGGTNAGLEVDYLLAHGKEWVKPGDIIILPLEYNHYEYSGKVNGLLIDYILSHDSDYFASMDLKNKAKFVVGISLSRVQKGIMAKLKNYQPNTNKDAYNIKTTNEYGDETKNLEADKTEQDFKDVALLTPMKILLQGGIQESYGMKSINKFVNWCRTQNIEVLATWPNTVWFDVYQQKQAQEFLNSIKSFYQNINISILGKPEDFMYDKSLFYNTIYHLHERGTRQRTKQLIEMLQPYLENLE